MSKCRHLVCPFSLALNGAVSAGPFKGHDKGPSVGRWDAPEDAGKPPGVRTVDNAGGSDRKGVGEAEDLASGFHGISYRSWVFG